MSKSEQSPKMRGLIKYMLVLSVISEVTSYTIISRRIQNQQPTLYRYKIYSPEVFADIKQKLPQRALRLTPSLLLAKDGFHSPYYRQRIRYNMKNIRPVVKPIPVHYRPRPSHSRPSEKRPLKSVVSNEVDDSSEEFYQIPDQGHVSFSNEGHFPSFGNGNTHTANIHKKPEFFGTSNLATESDESFTPIQTYYQVRQTNQVKHVPQSEAIKEATTLEELANAPRLKELLRTTRVREMYSEEGYEDTGYDHGAQIRHAEHDETYKAQDDGMFRIQENVREDDYTTPELKENGEIMKVIPVEEESQESKLDPKIVRSRSEISRTSLAYSSLPPKYKGEHKYSSKIRARKQGEGSESKSFDIVTTEMYPTRFWALPTVFESLTTPLSSKNTNLFMFDSDANIAKTEAIDTKNDVVEKIAPRSKYMTFTSSKEPMRYFPNYKGSNSSNTTGNGIKKNKQKSKTLKYTRLHSKFPKYDRFRWDKLNYLKTTSEPEQTRTRLNTNFDDKRIILPTIGYINSLTTAHFGKDKNIQTSNNNVFTTALNLTEALKYLRLNKQKNINDSIANAEKIFQENMHTDEYSLPFEPMKLKKGTRSRRELEKGEENTDSDETDDGEEIYDEKNVKIVEKEKQRLEDERKERKNYEKRLRHEIKSHEKEILKEALWKNGALNETEIHFQEKFNEATTAAIDYEMVPDTKAKSIDSSKYPFYFAEDVHDGSPLRYATNPESFPRKTGRGMEFYKSRDELVKCPDIRPELEDIPRKNATLESESEQRRITSLGDKIACLKKKYFDEDPLDNPIFKETEINYVGKTKNISFVQNRTLLEDTTKRDKKRAYSIVDEDIGGEPSDGNTNKTEEIKEVQYNSSYHHHPNRTLQIMAKNQNESTQVMEKKLWNERVIPVTEHVDEAPVPDHLATHHSLWGLPSPPLWQRRSHPIYRPFIASTVPPTQNPLARKKIIIPHNCMYVISKVAAQDGHKNLIIDCNDAILVQEIRNGIRHVIIMPKVSENALRQKGIYNKENTGESDWIPVIGYTGENKIIRLGEKNDKTDFPYEYGVTRLKEKESERKGEVLNSVKRHKNLFRKSKSSASKSKSDKANRPKRAAIYNYLERTLKHGKDIQNLQKKTPLKPGLREFLIHLRRDKSKAGLEPRPFQKPEEIESPLMGSQYLRGNNGQEMVYIWIDSSKMGHWVIGQVEAKIVGEAVRKNL